VGVLVYFFLLPFSNLSDKASIILIRVRDCPTFFFLSNLPQSFFKILFLNSLRPGASDRVVPASVSNPILKGYMFSFLWLVFRFPFFSSARSAAHSPPRDFVSIRYLERLPPPLLSFFAPWHAHFSFPIPFLTWARLLRLTDRVDGTEVFRPGWKSFRSPPLIYTVFTLVFAEARPDLSPAYPVIGVEIPLFVLALSSRGGLPNFRLSRRFLTHLASLSPTFLLGALIGASLSLPLSTRGLSLSRTIRNTCMLSLRLCQPTLSTLARPSCEFFLRDQNDHLLALRFRLRFNCVFVFFRCVSPRFFPFVFDGGSLAPALSFGLILCLTVPGPDPHCLPGPAVRLAFLRPCSPESFPSFTRSRFPPPSLGERCAARWRTRWVGRTQPRLREFFWRFGYALFVLVPRAGRPFPPPHSTRPVTPARFPILFSSFPHYVVCCFSLALIPFRYRVRS